MMEAEMGGDDFVPVGAPFPGASYLLNRRPRRRYASRTMRVVPIKKKRKFKKRKQVRFQRPMCTPMVQALVPMNYGQPKRRYKKKRTSRVPPKAVIAKAVARWWARR
jgi:hypothetical protein